MSYRLEHPQQLAEQIIHIGQEELRRAQRDLTDEDLNNGIHEARKRCKKIRALLRLARKPLGDDYAALNAAARDAAAGLAQLRDATAMLESLAQLENIYGAQLKIATFRPLRETLEAQSRDALAQQDPQQAVVLADARLAQLHERFRELSLPTDLKGKDLIAGIETTYDRGRQAFKEAANGGAEEMHEWRKRCKYLRYQLRLIRPCWKRELKAWVKELDTLGDDLGDHHDLAVMRQRIRDLPSDSFGKPRKQQTILSLLDARSDEIAARCRPVGERLWAEKSKPFAKRLRHYWQAWEHSHEQSPLLASTPSRPT